MSPDVPTQQVRNLTIWIEVTELEFAVPDTAIRPLVGKNGTQAIRYDLASISRVPIDAVEDSIA
jgi:hypothetical protein